jgi:hypothetical protein
VELPRTSQAPASARLRSLPWCWLREVRDQVDEIDPRMTSGVQTQAAPGPMLQHRGTPGPDQEVRSWLWTILGAVVPL